MPRSGWSAGTTDSTDIRHNMDDCSGLRPRWFVRAWLRAPCRSSAQPFFRRADEPGMSFDHERLDVYQRALEFLDLCDSILERLSGARAHLKDQLDRAATSIVLNVAEGARRVQPRREAPLLPNRPSVGHRERRHPPHHGSSRPRTCRMHPESARTAQQERVHAGAHDKGLTPPSPKPGTGTGTGAPCWRKAGTGAGR
jgi:hypothetical protein